MFLQKNSILCVLLLWLVTAFVPPAPAFSEDIFSPVAAENLVENGGYALQKNGRYIVAHNLHTPFIPASIIKIATALAALDILGPAAHFETFFYRDTMDNLYIKGFGDPFLTSEEVADIVRTLKEQGCTKINDIYLDDTAFQLETPVEGAGRSYNPYDAQNGALAVNFNTVNIYKDKEGKISAAEEQTPTLAVMGELAAGLEPGGHRISITRDAAMAPTVMSRYVGELFRAFQRRENIGGAGVIARKRVLKNIAPFYIHRSSKDLEEIIRLLLRYSNNFIANQVFLAAGAARHGYPATWEKGEKAMAAYLQQNNLALEEIEIFEGSGISRKNRVTAGAMIQILDLFKPYAGLLPREDNRLLKSGTLMGVYCYAGYFTVNQGLDSFVILLNQEQNNRDKLLAILSRIHRPDK